jgi:DNA-binding response OmpR family regulator
MLWDMSGIEVCCWIEVKPGTKIIPVIMLFAMLFARGTKDDQALGLSVGADDYVVKPHSIHELIA